jgi:molybdopterin/thiamine biosynthesis adenylyltransferase
MTRKHYIVGCGGVGSWLAPSLCLLRNPNEIILVDGDSLEPKNLNRQLFEGDDIGKNKADALSRRYECQSIPEWYSLGMIEHEQSDWIFCCVDNNPARAAVLHSCDAYGAQAIIAANETTSSEAYYYRRAWKDTPLDPRVYYPEIRDDHTNDPRGEAVGCTGEAQVANRQLVSANFSAAALAQNLFVLWGIKLGGLDKEVIPLLPYKFTANLSKLESFRVKDQMEKGQTNEKAN